VQKKTSTELSFQEITRARSNSREGRGARLEEVESWKEIGLRIDWLCDPPPLPHPEEEISTKTNRILKFRNIWKSS
jgi:hypothetical protein